MLSPSSPGIISFQALVQSRTTPEFEEFTNRFCSLSLHMLVAVVQLLCLDGICLCFDYTGEQAAPCWDMHFSGQWEKKQGTWRKLKIPPKPAADMWSKSSQLTFTGQSTVSGRSQHWWGRTCPFPQKEQGEDI